MKYLLSLLLLTSPLYGSDIVFTEWKSVQENVRLYKVLSDIEAHKPIKYKSTFENKITAAHEYTHFINSAIRLEYGVGYNGFYVLEDRAIAFKEPKCNISDIAKTIPKELREQSYQLYLVQQTKYWDDCPLYLFDELVAYTNGAECGIELNYNGWEYELLQAYHLNTYCLYELNYIKSYVEYDSFNRLVSFWEWNLKRLEKMLSNTKSKRVQLYIDKSKKHIRQEF